MGFCLFNNIAVAAAARRGLERVAVVDIDVHHGNGTQWMFYDDPRVLYVSTHQYPFYPGPARRTKSGPAPVPDSRSTCRSKPAPPTRTTTLCIVMPSCLLSVEFAPQLVLVSAGFDTHERDPLASMRMTERGYGTIVRRLMQLAPDGAIGFVTEGGYDLTALGSCLDETLAAVTGGAAALPSDNDDGRAPRGERALAGVRKAQHSFWPGL